MNPTHASKVFSAILGAAILGAALFAHGAQPQVGDVQAAAPARFQAFDIFIDSGTTPLAAYQIEVKDTAGHASIVGIEGGESLAFSQPPYHDPRAIQNEHVIIGDLSTADAAALPTGPTRIARLHVMVQGGEPNWTAILMTAGTVNAARIDATIQVRAAVIETEEGAGK